MGLNRSYAFRQDAVRIALNRGPHHCPEVDVRLCKIQLKGRFQIIYSYVYISVQCSPQTGVDLLNTGLRVLSVRRASSSSPSFISTLT